MTSVIQNILNQATISTMVFGTFSPFYQYSAAKKYAYGVSAELAPQIGLSVPYYGSITLGLNFELIAASVPTKIQDVRFKKEVSDKMVYLGTVGSFEGNEFKVEAIEKTASDYFNTKSPDLTACASLSPSMKVLNSTTYGDNSEYTKFAESFNADYQNADQNYHILFAGKEEDYDALLKSINTNKVTDANKDIVVKEKANNNYFVNRTGVNTRLKDIKFRPMKITVETKTITTTATEFAAYLEDLKEIEASIDKVDNKIGEVEADTAATSIGARDDVLIPDFGADMKAAIKKAGDYKTAIKALADKVDNSTLTKDVIEAFNKVKENKKSDKLTTLAKVKTWIRAEEQKKDKTFANGASHGVDEISFKADEIINPDFDEKSKAVLQNAVIEYFNKNTDGHKISITQKTTKMSADNLSGWLTQLGNFTVQSNFPEVGIPYFDNTQKTFKTGLETPALSAPFYELQAVAVNRITLLANIYRGFTVNVYTNVTGSKHINGFGFHGFFSLHSRLQNTFVENWSTYNLWSNQQVERKTIKIDFATAKALSNTIEDSAFKNKYYEVASADSAAGNSVKTLESSDYKDITTTVLSQSWSEVQAISLNSHKLAVSIFPSLLNGDSIRLQFTLPAINSASDAKLIKLGFMKTLYGNPLADDMSRMSITEEAEFAENGEVV